MPENRSTYRSFRFISGLTSASALTLIMALPSAAQEREIVQYEGFFWDYVQDYETCHYGATLGYDFCGYDQGWRNFSDRTFGNPPLFSYNGESSRWSILGTLDYNRYVHPDLNSLGASLPAAIAEQFGLHQSQIIILEQVETNVDGLPAVSFFFELEDYTYSPFIALTYWDEDGVSDTPISAAQIRYTFTTNSGDPKAADYLFDHHVQSLNLIRQYTQ